MDDLLQVLTQTALFRNIDPEVLRTQILPRGYLQHFAKNQFLIVPQQRVDRIGIVVTGKVAIQHIFSSGIYRLMRTVSEGDILGADLICTRSQLSPYHAVAAGSVALFSLPAAMLLSPGMLDEAARLEALGQLLQLISQENMKKEYRLAILSQTGLRDRIMTYLTMQARRQNTDTFTIPFTREELASFLCVNRSALSHELSLLQQDGLISFRKNQFTLHHHDPNAPSW